MNVLWVIADRLTCLVNKGESQSRYYNPEKMFNRVKIITTNSDNMKHHADADRMAGCELEYEPLWGGNVLFHRLTEPVMFKRWGDRVVEMARAFKPDLIRSGDRLSGYLAARAAATLDVPLVVSVHADYRDRLRDVNCKRVLLEFERWMCRYAFKRGRVIVVYDDLVPYVNEYGANPVKIPNVVCVDGYKEKTNWDLRKRILILGRHYPRVTPWPAIEASLDHRECEIDVVGDGPDHEHVEEIATGMNMITNMSNHELVNRMADYDIALVAVTYHGLPKTVMECMLVGLPVVVCSMGVTANERAYARGRVTVSPYSRHTYSIAITNLLSDQSKREKQARGAREWALSNWEPQETEKRWAQAYLNAMKGGICVP